MSAQRDEADIHLIGRVATPSNAAVTVGQEVAVPLNTPVSIHNSYAVLGE